MPRMTRETAEGILIRCHLTGQPDFHALSNSVVMCLQLEADAVRYL
jgi:hypothetical protein